MEESSTYQAILSRGRLQEARDIVLSQSQRMFGEPDTNTLATIEGITSRQRLEELVGRLFNAKSWQDLLANP